MKKLFLLICCIPILNYQAQTWCEWSFQYDFNIESNHRGYYNLDNLEVSINDEFASTRLQKSALVYNDSTNVYSVSLNFGCVSCGYEDAKRPPTTYLRIYLFDDFRKQHISIVIPVIFEDLEDESKLQKIELGTNPPYPVYLDLGTIFYENFIFFNSTFEKYEGINVKPDGKIYKYKVGEYEFPPTKKLIEIN